jgi:hypothetical protein
MTQSQNIVFVVDGDLAVREFLKFVLPIEGLAVFVFANGVELLAHPVLRMARCLVLDHKRDPTWRNARGGGETGTIRGDRPDGRESAAPGGRCLRRLGMDEKTACTSPNYT